MNLGMAEFTIESLWLSGRVSRPVRGRPDVRLLSGVQIFSLSHVRDMANNIYLKEKLSTDVSPKQVNYPEKCKSCLFIVRTTIPGHFPV